MMTDIQSCYGYCEEVHVNVEVGTSQSCRLYMVSSFYECHTAKGDARFYEIKEAYMIVCFN